MPVFLEEEVDLLLESGEPLLLEHEFIGSGGSLANGSVQQAIHFNPVATGGAEVGTASVINVIYYPVAAGGSTLSGFSDQTFFDIVEVGGGVLIIPRGFNYLGYIGQGGGAASGNSDVALRYFPEITGGSSAGSRAVIGIGHTPSGGILLDGDTVATAIYEPAVIGEIRASGDSNYGVLMFENGGIVVLGDESLIDIQFSWRRLRHHRFKLGDVAYVPVPTTSHYIRLVVRSIYSFGGRDVYGFGVGWFHCEELLTQDQYREWLKGR